METRQMAVDRYERSDLFSGLALWRRRDVFHWSLKFAQPGARTCRVNPRLPIFDGSYACYWCGVGLSCYDVGDVDLPYSNLDDDKTALCAILTSSHNSSTPSTESETPKSTWCFPPKSFSVHSAVGYLLTDGV